MISSNTHSAQIPTGSWDEENEASKVHEETVVSDFASPPVRANKGSASHAIISGSEGAGMSPLDGSGGCSN